MDTTRRLRGATPADVSDLVALVHRRHPVARNRAELWLQRLLGGPQLSIVVDDPMIDGIAAALIARPLGTPDGRWAVDLLDVKHRSDAERLIPVLLTAAADRLVRSGVSLLVVPNEPTDLSRAQILTRSSLSKDCWMVWSGRIELLDEPPSDYEPGLPLPHSHGLHTIGVGRELRRGAASAWSTTAVLPFDSGAALEVVDLLDPFVAYDAESLDEMVTALGVAIGAGELPHRVAVAISPGEIGLDTVLRRYGFRPVVDWWRLDLIG